MMDGANIVEEKKSRNQQLVDYLRECGVCQICQLRYLQARGSDYKNITKTFEQLKINPLSGLSNTDDNDDDEEQIATKKQRPSIECCSTCLGLFSNEFQEQLIEGIIQSNIAKFECETVGVGISLPMLLQVRQLSMWLALCRKFGKTIDRNRPPDVPLKEAIKLILNPIICERLQKTYNTENGIMINISLTHSADDKEMSSLRKFHDIAFPPINGGDGGRSKYVISRGVLEKQYTPVQIEDSLFCEHLPSPPLRMDACLCMDMISLAGPTVFVAGRYRKISRTLSHTPWVLNGKRVMEDSIEEIIVRNVTPFFCDDVSRINFMSSGREDVDVRCLGKGRPFVLEIPNARRTQLPRHIARDMEKDTDNSMKVSVRDLQIVQREELIHIKTGEEHKRKLYRALCHIDEPATIDLLQKLDIPNGFEIQQKTPLRVLHRRPLHTRPRRIYSVKAYLDRENHCALILDIVSQAGTYIKELVHGEFGRTTPSIASIISRPIDIVALDVVGIDLDWPKEINDLEHDD